MKRNSIIFIIMFVFFIVVAVGALFMLNPSSSVFNKDSRSIGAQTAVMSKTVVGDEPTEDYMVQDTIDTVVETAAEEVVEEAVTEDNNAFSENAEGAAGEGSGEGTGSGDAAAEAVPEQKYFTFKTSTTRTVLNFRKEPSSDSKILWKLAPGTFGYILLIGDEWSRVALENGEIGYCATEYLDMTEVTKADFPAEFAELVGVPDENVTIEDGR